MMTAIPYNQSFKVLQESMLSIQSRSRMMCGSAGSILNYLGALNSIGPCNPRTHMYEHEVEILMNELKTSATKIMSIIDVVEKQLKQ